MRVCISGASGVLGRYVVETLLSQSIEVITITRGGAPSQAGAKNTISDYSFADLVRVIDGSDACVHLAGVRGGAGAFSTFLPNIELTDTLLAAAYRCQVPRIVLASSISVYSQANKAPWTESQAALPAGNYGLSKLAMESIGERARLLRGQSVISLRFGHIYGALENNPYLVNRFFRQAFAGEPLYVSPPSDRRRDLVYADDCARAVTLALQSDYAAAIGPVNIGGGDPLSNYQIATATCEGFGTDSQVVIDPTISDEKSEPTQMDISLAHTLLGYNPQWSYAQAAADIYQRMRNNSEISHHR